MRIDTKFRKAMTIENESKRLAALENIALSIGFHGGTWFAVMDEIRALRAKGVKTPLQIALENGAKFK